MGDIEDIYLMIYSKKFHEFGRKKREEKNKEQIVWLY